MVESPLPRPVKPTGVERRGEVVALTRAPASDNDLVCGIIEQRPAAIAELFDRYAALVRRTLVRTLGSAQDLDDLTQETFLTVIRRCETLRDAGALRSFVVSVAIRIARNELRKRALRRFVGLADAPRLPMVGPHDVESAECIRHLYDALERLGAEGRIVFVLRHVEGYDLVQTASACDCSLATVKRRLAKAEARFEAIVRNDPVLRDYLRSEEEA